MIYEIICSRLKQFAYVDAIMVGGASDQKRVHVHLDGRDEDVLMVIHTLISIEYSKNQRCMSGHSTLWTLLP